MKARWVLLSVGIAVLMSALAGAANAQPCIVPDDGSGTVNLPPPGCGYLSPNDVHEIIAGLPAGTTITVAAEHKFFFCEGCIGGINAGKPCSSAADCPGGQCRAENPLCSHPVQAGCDQPGGNLGGESECSKSTLALTMDGTGGLANYHRVVDMPIAFETHTGPRTPGQPIQSFDTEMFRLDGQLPAGDPDFDLLRIRAGSGFNLPSPGHTTLVRQGPPGSNWAVDSFFDITYRIDFVGRPGGPLSGHSGSTTGTIRMQTGGGGGTNVPCCLPGGICVNTSATTFCLSQGGTPVAACQGDINGDGIDEACFSPPCSECGPGPHWIHNPACPPGGSGSDTMPSGAYLGIDTNLDCIADTNIVAFGPVTISKAGPFDDSTNFPGTRPVDTHLDVIDTEMLAMTLTSGGVTLRAGTYSGSSQTLQPSKGAIAEQAGNPSLADSFFDVFFEVQNGVNFYYNQTPIQVAQVIDCVPPKSNYFHLGGCIPLYNSPVAPAVHVANLVQANHFTYPACCSAAFAGGCAPNIPASQCTGTVVPACLGDGNGNGVDDACDPKCDRDPTSPTGCSNTCPPPIPPNGACLPTKSGCNPNQQGSCGVLECDCIDDTSCRLFFNAAGQPFCQGNCPVPPGGTCNLLGSGAIGDPYYCDCGGVPPVCEPNSTQTGCNTTTCPILNEVCQPKCAHANPFTGMVSVTDCDCVSSTECHMTGNFTGGAFVAARGPGGNPCTVPNDGSGTVNLPPEGCGYLSPDDVHMIINGLPVTNPPTTIVVAAEHKFFFCQGCVGGPNNGHPCSSAADCPGGTCRAETNPTCSHPVQAGCDQPGGDLGGESECSKSTLTLTMTGTGNLAGFNRNINLGVEFEAHTAPRTPGQPIQSFDTEMFRLFGQISNIGDPDFDLLRIVAGNDFNLPSPGHTTLTMLPGGTWAVDSFFDITYRIDFVGTGPRLGGMSGSTTGTIRMQTGTPTKCQGVCAAGTQCVETRTVNADGTIDICCDCVTPPPTCAPLADGSACNQTTCATGEPCRPTKIVCSGPAPQICRITECGCGDTCHVIPGTAAAGPACTGPCTDPVPPQRKCVRKKAQVAGGIQYECRCLPVYPPPTGDPTGILKNRYLTMNFGASAGAARGTPLQAIRVKMVSLMHPDPPNLPQFPPPNFTAFEGQSRWVGPPSLYTETESPFSQFMGSGLQCDPNFQDWSGVGTVQVFAGDIVPSSLFDVQSVDVGCDIDEEDCYSSPLNVATGRSGDVASAFQLSSPNPLTQPNISDIVAVVDKFKGLAGAPIVARGDLHPALPNRQVNIADVTIVIDAFKNFAYPFPGPCACPPIPLCPAVDACGRCHP